MTDMELDIIRMMFDSLPSSDDDTNIIVSRKIQANRLIIGVSNVHRDEFKQFEVVLREIQEDE